MFFRLLAGFALLVMLVGVYRGFTTGYSGMGLLFLAGAVAIAIPLFFDRK